MSPCRPIAFPKMLCAELDYPIRFDIRQTLDGGETSLRRTGVPGAGFDRLEAGEEGPRAGTINMAERRVAAA